MSDDQYLEQKAELLEAVDDTRVEDVLKPIPTDAMETALESIHALKNISDTISVEGVSIDDLRSITQIHTTLADTGMDLGPNVSMENYVGLVTPYRSGLNLKVSNESIGKSIIETIKKWIGLLFDAITRSIQWIKSALKNDNLVQLRIKTFDNAAIKMFGIYKYIQSVNPRSQNELLPYLKELAKDNLNNGGLPKSPVVAVALGQFPLRGPVHTRLFKGLYAEINTASDNLDARVAALQELLQSYDGVDVLQGVKLNSYDNNNELTGMIVRLDDFFVESADPDYLSTIVDEDYYVRPEHILTKREFFGYSAIYDNFTKVTNTLAKIRKVKIDYDEMDLEAVSNYIKTITQQIKDLNHIVTRLIELRAVYIKASAMLINYYIKAFDLIRSDHFNAPLSDIARGNWTKADRDMNDIKKKVGL